MKKYAFFRHIIGDDCMELRLNEVKTLPEYSRNKWKKIVMEFVEKNIGIAEVSGDIPKTARGFPLISGLKYAIRILGLSDKIWATVRNKKVYLINSEISGLKKTKSSKRIQKIYGDVFSNKESIKMEEEK